MNAMARDGLPRGTVPSAFDTEARFYDRLVGANPGYHEHLRLSARRLGLPAKAPGPRVLDVGCGTGASTAALLSVVPNARITAFDASGEMLERARSKTWPGSVEFVHTPVEELAGIHGPFDGILAAYLLRNLTEPTTQLRRLRELLRPGGRIAVHEYSVRDSRRARLVWNAVCAGVIIPLGKLTTGDATLYRHLRRSVLEFDGIAALTRRLTEAGFTDVHTATVGGWQRGIVHTVVGTAPLETP
ncbi:class I SAM-dependent methyltransferase [Amycolatopsis regifaucium]|uniref:Ubiquinone biosynthesis methyltransferase UbiE n=1 Tax=Amycolatopsis regifaucium TaxID=546365 RepID=A0A154MWA4_9PSEU|nr:class I SAM-dependent methyltransferase [Amycolatopsis regifaucium]KZB88280.1 ubiquinone biosynthesis methyltransferase UbiE [Amycolatopsis regifaucium]OKA11392.1 ubiquinone biosynthesis methyltransferase UbiE [Amycolatopsis regifaucium]SFH43001.1 Ubiquinone/menaquinone biosynthesis C-methylase UbiE [Amycolatopsis regifaucium]